MENISFNLETSHETMDWFNSESNFKPVQKQIYFCPQCEKQTLIQEKNNEYLTCWHCFITQKLDFCYGKFHQIPKIMIKYFISENKTIYRLDSGKKWFEYKKIKNGFEVENIRKPKIELKEISQKQFIEVISSY
jgi:hypothetical protein